MVFGSVEGLPECGESVLDADEKELRGGEVIREVKGRMKKSALMGVHISICIRVGTKRNKENTVWLRR